MPDLRTYIRSVFWSNEDNCWFVTCEAFPGLSAFRDTPVEALAEFDVLLQEAIETYEQEGWTLPQPGSYAIATPWWIFVAALVGLIETVIILVWLALRWIPAGW